jgi:hypothetical protein
MNKFLAILKLFPVILGAVKAVEEAIPLPGQGKKKLDMVLNVVQLAYEGSAELSQSFSWDKLVAVVVPMIGNIVEVHNELGLFSKAAGIKAWIERCRLELAAIDAELRAGAPDVEGLCLALQDWSAELRILEALPHKAYMPNAKTMSKTMGPRAWKRFWG